MTDWEKRRQENVSAYEQKQLSKVHAAEKDMAQAAKDRADPRMLVPSDERIKASHGATKKPSEIMNEAPAKAQAKTSREMKMDSMSMKPSEMMKNARHGEDKRRGRGR